MEKKKATLSDLVYDPGTGIAVGMWLYTLTDGSTCFPRYGGRVVDGLAVDPVSGQALRYIIAAGMPVGEIWRVDGDVESMTAGSEAEDEEVESADEEELRRFESEERAAHEREIAKLEAFVSDAETMLREAKDEAELKEAWSRVRLFDAAIPTDSEAKLLAIFDERLMAMDAARAGEPAAPITAMEAGPVVNEQAPAQIVNEPIATEAAPQAETSINASPSSEASTHKHRKAKR